MTTVQQVECSGHVLEPDVTLFGMTLFAGANHDVLAYVNLRDKECATSRVYSACVIDGSDYRKTKLMALVLDLRDDESRMYGCNVTSLKSGKGHIISWSIHLRLTSGYSVVDTY